MTPIKKYKYNINKAISRMGLKSNDKRCYNVGGDIVKTYNRRGGLDVKLSITYHSDKLISITTNENNDTKHEQIVYLPVNIFVEKLNSFNKMTSRVGTISYTDIYIMFKSLFNITKLKHRISDIKKDVAEFADIATKTVKLHSEFLSELEAMETEKLRFENEWEHNWEENRNKIKIIEGKIKTFQLEIQKIKSIDNDVKRNSEHKKLCDNISLHKQRKSIEDKLSPNLSLLMENYIKSLTTPEMEVFVDEINKHLDLTKYCYNSGLLVKKGFSEVLFKLG